MVLESTYFRQAHYSYSNGSVQDETRIVQLDGGGSSQAYGIGGWYKNSDDPLVTRKIPQTISIIAATATASARIPAPEPAPEKQQEEGVLVIYPNPTPDGLVTVSYSLPAEVINEAVSVSVYNMLGALVYQQKVGNGTTGQIQLNLSKLPTGNYNLILQAGAYQANKKLTLE